MNHEPDELPPDLQHLLVDVVDGRCDAAAAQVRAACAASPVFTAQLQGALRARDLVVAHHGAAREALAAGAAPLEAFAVATARRQLGLPQTPIRPVASARRWWPWLWVALAAGLTIAMLWRVERPGPRPSAEVLGEPIPVHVSADGSELSWDAVGGEGEHFVIEFRDASTGDVVQTIRDARTSRLPMPDLRHYAGDVLVAVRLVDVGNTSLRESSPLTLPARTRR